MTSRVLIVDDVPANVKLLEAHLTAEYFDVRTAANGREALAIAMQERVDVVLLDVMMPDMSGFEVCRRLKAHPYTAHVPVVIVTALDQPGDRVKGLECGADDFLTKPVSEIALMARVKSLARLKAITDELSVRNAALSALGDPAQIFQPANEVSGRILVIDDQPGVRRTVRLLSETFPTTHAANPQEGLRLAAGGEYDLFALGLDLRSADGLRLIMQLRALDNARQTPVLVFVNPDETGRLLRGLEMGVNDYVMRPVDPNELRARVRTQLKRKIYSDRLRTVVASAMTLALTDPLTGLHNRRYFANHMAALLDRSATDGSEVALLLFDIDHFKSINDRFGHDVGDMVLKEFAGRLKAAVRGIDTVARFGGEEFVVVMPEMTEQRAIETAERIRASVGDLPFAIGAGREHGVTVSIGVGCFRGRGDTLDALVKRADDALYRAKRGGRNKVMLEAA